MPKKYELLLDHLLNTESIVNLASVTNPKLSKSFSIISRITEDGIIISSYLVRCTNTSDFETDSCEEAVEFYNELNPSNKNYALLSF